MIERVRELGALRLAAIPAVILVLAGGVVWLLADRDSSESTTELAERSPEPGPGTAPASDRNETAGRADDETDPRRERGRDREPRDRKRPARSADGERTESPKPAPAQGPEPQKKNVERIVENLLGGGDSDRGSSQPPPDLPPEVAALLQGGADGQGPSKPPRGLEDLLEGNSAGD